MDKWTNEWMDGWIDEWTNEWMDGWMNDKADIKLTNRIWCIQSWALNTKLICSWLKLQFANFPEHPCTWDAMDYKRHERMGSPMTRSSLHKRATYLVLTTLSRGKRSDQKAKRTWVPSISVNWLLNGNIDVCL